MSVRAIGDMRLGYRPPLSFERARRIGLVLRKIGFEQLLEQAGSHVSATNAVIAAGKNVFEIVGMNVAGRYLPRFQVEGVSLTVKARSLGGFEPALLCEYALDTGLGAKKPAVLCLVGKYDLEAAL